MNSGTDTGLMYCLRGKLDMQNPNKSLRDPVYYCCNLTPHHRIGAKYKVYPTFNSVHTLILCKVSLMLLERVGTMIVMINTRIQKDKGLRKIHIFDFSRLNMVKTVLSKRKLLWFVQNGKVEGWDDPRFPTVQGIARRGLEVEALIQFILAQASKNVNNYHKWDKLWSINKKRSLIQCALDILQSLNKGIIKDENGIITQLVGFLHLEGSVNKTTLKLTWLPDSSELVRLTLVDFDHLITVDKVEKDEGFH